MAANVSRPSLMVIPRRRTDSITLLAFVAAGLAACSGGSDPQKELDSLRSWRESAHLAADAVHLGWVPRRYGKEVHERGTAALNESRQSPPKGATAADSASLRSTERALEASLDSLAS
ncbi:MAG: hypothetical protein HOQ09_06135, partial [Gemmatimonadaceae bacterium]|nr:hypothetical protein [Gemmatimonadaceae bacterium]